MRIFIKLLFGFVKNSLCLFVFLVNVFRYRCFSNSINKKHFGTLNLLANGPSLNVIIPQLNIDKEFCNVDFIVVNYFAFEDIFFVIKPKHYCLADPMFFGDSFRKDDVEKLFYILQNKVDWVLNLYIPKTQYGKFIEFSKIENKHIIIHPLNLIEYNGFESLRFFFYKKGLAMPRVQTVANMAIFVGINSGYSMINLYGVEHSFLDSLCVNERNQLCNRDKHFYDNGEAPLKPIYYTGSETYIWKIGDYLAAISQMFKSHDILSEYAKYVGAEIVNCTKGSMIDSYERRV